MPGIIPALLDEGIVSFPKIAFQLISLNNRKLKGHIIMLISKIKTDKDGRIWIQMNSKQCKLI